jgi:hypothetical protein
MQLGSGKRAGTSRSYGFPYYMARAWRLFRLDNARKWSERLTTLSLIKVFHSHCNWQGGLWWAAVEKEECETLPQSTFLMAVQASGWATPQTFSSCSKLFEISFPGLFWFKQVVSPWFMCNLGETYQYLVNMTHASRKEITNSCTWAFTNYFFLS